MLPPVTVLALHAGAVDPSYWDDVRAEAPELSFVTPHLGRLAEATGGNGLELVERLAALVPEGPVVVTGASLGALLAPYVAVRLGPRTRGLLLISGVPVDDDDPFHQRMAGILSFMSDSFEPTAAQTMLPVMLYRFGPRFASAAPRLSAMLLREGGPRSMALAAALGRLPRGIGKLVEQLPAPIDVWFGRYDPMVEPAWVPQWQQVKNARVSVVDSAAHQIPMEYPERVAEALRRLAAPEA